MVRSLAGLFNPITSMELGEVPTLRILRARYIEFIVDAVVSQHSYKMAIRNRRMLRLFAETWLRLGYFLIL